MSRDRRKAEWRERFKSNWMHGICLQKGRYGLWMLQWGHMAWGTAWPRGSFTLNYPTMEHSSADYSERMTERKESSLSCLNLVERLLHVQQACLLSFMLTSPKSLFQLTASHHGDHSTLTFRDTLFTEVHWLRFEYSLLLFSYYN